MAFEPYETSVEESRPRELYTIQLGARVWRYTSADGAVDLGGDVFEPLAISRGAPAQSQEDQDQQLEVRLPASTPVCRFYIQTVPGEEVSLRIERYQTLDVSVARVVIYDGLIQTVTFEKGGAEAVLSIVTRQSAYSRTIPRDVYSGVCNHVLYDPRCSLDDTVYRVTQEVLAVSANTLTIDGLDAQADGYYTAGFIELTGSERDFRTILAHVGELVTVALPFGTSPVGTLVRVYPGCDHSPDTCQAKFNNVINFGGFPFVPTKNPFQTGLK